MYFIYNYIFHHVTPHHRDIVLLTGSFTEGTPEHRVTIGTLKIIYFMSSYDHKIKRMIDKHRTLLSSLSLLSFSRYYYSWLCFSMNINLKNKKLCMYFIKNTYMEIRSLILLHSPRNYWKLESKIVAKSILIITVSNHNFLFLPYV